VVKSLRSKRLLPFRYAPITNVHISNEGNNNSNNTIVGDNNVIINANFGITINV
jgi:hypothetical protein